MSPRPAGLLFDLDGVIYNADEPIDGAAETLAWVRRQAIPHLFVTNTTSKPALELQRKLERFGIPAEAGQVWTPLAATRQWLSERPEGKAALFLREAARADLAGLPVVDDDAETGADFVVIGDLGSAWDFARLNRAFRLLHSNPEATLIALGRTRYWRAPDGISLDVAPFVAALECAIGREAITLGKPSRTFFEVAAARLGLAPHELLMIGDDVLADVGGAQAAGLRGALVRTGKFRPEDLEGAVRPDAVIDSVAELPSLLRER
ncbi:MAG: TIGR01458 family HAD-type hydrolase [Acidobacteria bacterium]|nr:TIGR01458 family HAD-type hydrolase [Acidobacteriota bacterium]